MVSLSILIIVALVLPLLYVYSPCKRPFLTESTVSLRKTLFFRLYYASKYLSPVKKPFRGTELEQIFTRDMSPDPGRTALRNFQPVVIKAVGDLMCRKDLTGEGGKGLWDQIGADVFSGDLRIANMEFAVNPDCVIENRLRFSVPEFYALPLLGDSRFGKFDIVSLANNHINDSLSGGIISTCDFLDKMEIAYSGACRTPDERDLFPVFKRGGINIAVLSYTYSTNGIALESHFQHGVNRVNFNALHESDYDPAVIYCHVELARSRGADFIIACNHWGIEFEYYPPERIVRRGRELLDSGIDLIIGTHPQIINLSERYRTKDGREGVIIYSLGSLTSAGLRSPVQRMSHLAEITLETGYGTQGEKVVRTGGVRFTPVFHSMRRKGRIIAHKLLPVIKTVENLENGTSVCELSRSEIRILHKLYREHRNHFRQNGFEYT
ncbi:MAG TPA: CapA family protein [Chitinispirillaceae bacterium]|mgnify:FL=1|nr:CapA family protein [Chitinispirillaceae bacterium]